MRGERLPCDRAELRTLFLFEKLTDDQLDWLCRHGHVERFEPGYVYREDDLATAFFYVLQAISQHDRLVALGSLPAGLTHELNNPAAAAPSATAALRQRIAALRHQLGCCPRGRSTARSWQRWCAYRNRPRGGSRSRCR